MREEADKVLWKSQVSVYTTMYRMYLVLKGQLHPILIFYIFWTADKKLYKTAEP